MEYYRLLSLCSFLYLVGIGKFALANNWEIWHAALPNTQMPKTLLKILQPSGKQVDTKNPYSGIGKGALNLNDNKLQLGSAFPTAGKDSYSTGPNDGPDKPITVPHDITTFFLEKDLHSGNKMTLYFPKSTTLPAKFLPRHSADAVPFSTKQFPQILSRFSIKPGSPEARVVRETIEDCEAPSVKGEDKYCATSLQSLIDFGVSRLGRDVEVFATEVEADDQKKRVFSIGEGGVRKIGEKSVVCHKQNYVYAVFYCHEVHATRAYVVSLAGADGMKAEAVAVCHTDTRFWSAELLAFKVLNVKPGTVPVCHFLPNDSLVWVPK